MFGRGDEFAGRQSTLQMPQGAAEPSSTRRQADGGQTFMTFQPIIPGAGIAGWRFLQRTYDDQFSAFAKSPQLQRDTEYFKEKIGSIQSAEDLVKDRRLLGVALGAFGLQADIDNKYFIQKILQDGTESDDALSNRLSDKRYKEFSAAFGFGPGETPTTSDPVAMAALSANNGIQAFEVSVGEQDDSMRIALYAQRELVELSKADKSEDAKWFTLMGLPPLRSMFETALGLPKSFGQIDIDQQLEVFQDKVRGYTGNSTVAQFADPEALERITTLYLARSQIASFNATTSPGATALTLLRAGSN